MKKIGIVITYKPDTLQKCIQTLLRTFFQSYIKIFFKTIIIQAKIDKRYKIISLVHCTING